MRIEADEARRRFAAATVARLATIRPDGRPHLVPVTFVVVDDRVEMSVDAKPKRAMNVERLRNLEANPEVTMLVDHYADDWSELWWVRADGDARLVGSATEREAIVERLLAKYPQYGSVPREFGATMVVDVARWSGWAWG